MIDLMKNRPDFQDRRSNRKFTKWFPLAQVLRKRGIDAAMPIEYTQDKFWHGYLTNRVIGFNNGHDMGRVKVKWYVSFLDPKDP